MNWRKIFLIVGAIIVIFYLFTLKGNWDIDFANTSKCRFESAHECSPFATIISIIHDKSLAFNSLLAEFGKIDVGTYEGKDYSAFPPGLALLALPFFYVGSYFGLGQLLSFSVVMLATFANAFLLYNLSQLIFLHSRRVSLITAVVYSLSSTAWSYGTSLYQHQVGTLLILVSLWLVVKTQRSERIQARYILPFLCIFGLSGHIDYPNVVLLFPIFVYLIILLYNKIKGTHLHMIRLKVFGAIVSLLVILFASYPIYNHYVFGKWWIVHNRLPVKERFLDANEEELRQITLEKSLPHNIFNLKKVPYGIFVLTFSADRGLLFFSPIFLLAGIALLQKRSIKFIIEHKVILSIIVLNFIIYASYTNPWGGLSFGPRFLIPSMALLSLYVGVYISHVKHFFSEWIIVFLLTYSQAIALLGALTSNMLQRCAFVPDLGKCSYLYNISLISSDKSSSFVFNEFFRGYVPLTTIFILMMIILFSLNIYLVFIASDTHKQKVL